MLLTGASGLVGGILREQWGDRYQLRLADIQTIEGGRSRSKLPLNPSHEEFVLLDTSERLHGMSSAASPSFAKVCVTQCCQTLMSSL